MGLKLEACQDEPELTWETLGFRGRTQYVADCQSEWRREVAKLSSADINVASDVCAEATTSWRELTCGEVVIVWDADLSDP